MTHDELLAKLADIHNKYSDAGAEANKQYKGMVMFYSTLRAVVELHKPMKEPKKSGWFEGEEYKEGYVIGCEFDNYHYPCPTIQAIEKELN